MDNTIIVTVSVASFNNAPYIERCIDSVISQTYENLDILIIDDGSTDDSIERIQKYAFDDRIRIVQKDNGGLSSVRQMALDIARGEYICFIDADDYLAPTYVESMLNKLLLDGSDICVCSTRFEDEKGLRLDKLSEGFACLESCSPFQTDPMQFFVTVNRQLELLHLSDSWNKMYKLSSIKSYKVNFSMPKGLNGSDTLFNRLVALHSPLYSCIPGELYYHVIYRKSAVHRKKKNLLLTYQIIAEQLILESKKLCIFNQTKNYIFTKYNSNFVEVLIDEYKDSAGIIPCICRFYNLKDAHTKYAKRVEPRLLSIAYANTISVWFCVVIFKYLTFSLPFFFGLVDQFNKYFTKG